MIGSDKDRSFARGVAVGVAFALAFGIIAGGAALVTVRPWTACAGSTNSTCSPGFADLVARVGPAVVSVVVQQDSGSEIDTRTAAPIAAGAAFFISADGYLVTADHVVSDAKSVQIRTTEGVSYPARLVGSDYWTDVAVLKVDAEKVFPHVEFADQPPRVGDWVVAIGNPFGLSATATAGIVSAVERDVGDPYENYLQVDAPINEGDSGGPTFDLRGKVVGVNDAIVSPSAGGSTGIAFAIPAKTAKAISATLISSGSVARGWLGLHVQDGVLASVPGALVSDTESNGPAAEAGIVPGDVVTAINGAQIKDARGLTQSLIGLDPGTTVQLVILRNGQMETITVMLGVMPRPGQATESQRSSTNVDRH